MSNELHAVHVVVDYEGHCHLSIHVSYAEAKRVAVSLASSEYDLKCHRVFVAPVELGADLIDLSKAEEILDASS